MHGKSLSNPAKKAIKHRDAAFMPLAVRKAAKHGIKTSNGKGARGARKLTNLPLRHVIDAGELVTTVANRRVNGRTGGLRFLAACDLSGINPKVAMAPKQYEDRPRYSGKRVKVVTEQGLREDTMVELSEFATA